MKTMAGMPKLMCAVTGLPKMMRTLTGSPKMKRVVAGMHKLTGPAGTAGARGRQVMVAPLCSVERIVPKKT
jgi:hypothetical protein